MAAQSELAAEGRGAEPERWRIQREVCLSERRWHVPAASVALRGRSFGLAWSRAASGLVPHPLRTRSLDCGDPQSVGEPSDRRRWLSPTAPFVHPDLEVENSPWPDPLA